MCFLFFSNSAANKKPQLTIEIQNIEVVEGNIKIGVFNTRDKFLIQGSIFKSYVIAVNDTTETIIIDDLPKREYA